MLTVLCTRGMRHCTTSRASNTSFIRLDVWPSNSPDFNLVHYKIWYVTVVIFDKFELVSSQTSAATDARYDGK